MSGRKRKVWYDARCEDLAEHFLVGDELDTPTNRESLAADIQIAVEDWFDAARPPMVDRSELYPGAVVTVRVRIIELNGDKVAFCVAIGREAGAYIRVATTDILSVEPRPLAVGDRVRNGLRARSVGGEIIHVHNGAAWVDYGNSSWLEPLAELIRIPDEPAPAEQPPFKPGDEVEAALDISGTLHVGVILAVAGDDAWVNWGDHFGRRTEPLDTLTPRTTTERAP